MKRLFAITLCGIAAWTAAGLPTVRFDPATGASTVWFTEAAARPDYWVNLSDNYRFLKDGSLLWWSERDGYGHFYRYAGGAWQQLTSGTSPTTTLVGVDEEASALLLEARALRLEGGEEAAALLGGEGGVVVDHLPGGSVCRPQP